MSEAGGESMDGFLKLRGGGSLNAETAVRSL